MRQSGNHAVLAYHEVMPESDYAYCVTSGSFAQHLALFDSVAKDAWSEASCSDHL